MVQGQKPDQAAESAEARNPKLDAPQKSHPEDSARSALQAEANTLRKALARPHNDSKPSAAPGGHDTMANPFLHVEKLHAATAARPQEQATPSLPFSPGQKGDLPTWDPVNNKPLPGWNEQHRERVGRAHAGAPDIAFYGDSITDGMQLSNDFGKFDGSTKNFGIHGDTTQNLRYRLEHGELDFKDGKAPKNFVLLIGTNDIGKGKTHEQIARDAMGDADLIAKKFPESKILVLGLLPRGGLRDEVTDINKYLKADVTAKHSPNMRFADVGRVMLDRHGAQDPKLWQADLTHPTYGAGYARLLPAIKKVLESDK